MFLDVAHRVSLVSEARTSAAPPLTVPAPAAAPGGERTGRAPANYLKQKGQLLMSKRSVLMSGGCLGFRVFGFRFWVLGFGFWVLGLGFWVLGFGFWVLGFGFWV